MKRDSIFSQVDARHAKFERDWNRTRKIMRLWAIFVALVSLTIFVGVGYTIFSVATNPASVGEFVGQIEQGYKKAN